MIHRSITLLLISVLVLTASSGWAQPVTLESALDRLDSAIATAPGAPDQAVLEAAAVLEDALEREGTRTSASELTLGNAYLLGGDMGRAVLHYSRGLSIDPNDEQLRTNLARALDLVDPKLPERSAASALDRVTTTLNGSVPHSTRWWIGAVALGVLSLSCTARALGTRFPAHRSLITLSAVSLVVSGGWLFAQRALSTIRSQVVVLDEGVIAHSGPDSRAYGPIYDAPLGAGTTGTLNETRRGWASLTLGNGDTAWVPEDSIGRVVPDAHVSPQD